jgi:hypothetical protein
MRKKINVKPENLIFVGPGKSNFLPLLRFVTIKKAMDTLLMVK